MVGDSSSEQGANARGVLSRDPYVAKRQLENNPNAAHYYADNGPWPGAAPTHVPSIDVSTTPGSWRAFFWTAVVFGPFLLLGWFYLSQPPSSPNTNQEASSDFRTKINPKLEELALARIPYMERALRYVEENIEWVSTSPPDVWPPRIKAPAALEQLQQIAMTLDKKAQFQEFINVTSGRAGSLSNLDDFSRSLSVGSFIRAIERLMNELGKDGRFTRILNESRFAAAKSAVQGLPSAKENFDIGIGQARVPGRS